MASGIGPGAKFEDCKPSMAVILVFQDIIGKRGYLALVCAVATIPVFGLLAFTYVYPLVSTLWLGVTYSVAAVSLSTHRAF